MKTFLIGDLHGSIDFNTIYRYGPHPKDRLIQLGDFGLLFHPVATEDEKRMLNELQEFWGEVLWVDGNHENFDRLDRYPKMMKYGGWVRQIAPRVFQLMRGETYEIDGDTFFVMGGGDSIDKHMRVEGQSWWKEEQPSFIELERGLDNLDKVDWKVDYVLTHTCPESTKMTIMNYMRLVGSSDHLENYLENVKKDLNYKRWYFGHFHVDVDLPDNTTGLYKQLTPLGESVDPEMDDFVSGFYAPSQREPLPKPIQFHGADEELIEYLKNKRPGFHETKVLDTKK